MEQGDAKMTENKKSEHNIGTGKIELEHAPFAAVAFPTEEDYNQYLKMVDFWKAHHEDKGMVNDDE